jgi:hypothetical protein
LYYLQKGKRRERKAQDDRDYSLEVFKGSRIRGSGKNENDKAQISYVKWGWKKRGVSDYGNSCNLW